MASNDFNPGQVLTGYMDPNHLRPEILMLATEILNLNLSTLQSVIAVSGKDFFTCGHEGRAFMAFYISFVFVLPSADAPYFASYQSLLTTIADAFS